MILVTFLDQTTITVPADEWRVNGPVLQVGAVVVPLANVRMWETVETSDEQ